MDLANMRSLGVTKVDVYYACGHQATIDVFDLPGGWCDIGERHIDLRSRTFHRFPCFSEAFHPQSSTNHCAAASFGVSPETCFT
jgi:hypothetical protein